jgi:hypothetical protein
LVRRFRIHLSYANVMATVAVFVALGGSSYAAFALPKNSVGSRQLKNHAVTPKKVAKSTVALFKGRKGDRGPAGIQGPAGAQGSPGSQGPTGPSNAYHATENLITDPSPSVSVPAGDYVVSGDANAGVQNGASLDCRIQLNGADAGSFASASNEASNPENVNVADSASLHLSSPGTISNSCGIGGNHSGSQESRSVTAIRVGSVSP